MAKTSKVKLPPLMKYQVDLNVSAEGKWMQSPASYFSVRAAQEDWRVKDYPAGSLLVIRRLSDGKVMWANDAAKERGIQ